MSNTEFDKLTLQGGINRFGTPDSYFQIDPDGSTSYNGSAIPGIDLENLSDVMVVAIANNDVLQWDSVANKWKNVNDPTLTTAKIGDTVAGNYSEFEEDGTLKFNGDATVYRDINLSGASLVPGGASAPDQINFINGNLIIYGFDGTGTTERLYGSLEMQHDYKEGSDIEVHIHWCPTTAGVGNVVWQMYISWQNNGGAVFPAGTLYVAPPTATGGVAWGNQYTSVVVIPGAGKTINSQIVLQLFRDPGNAGDTYTADAGLIQIGIHYQCDTTGSRFRAIK